MTSKILFSTALIAFFAFACASTEQTELDDRTRVPLAKADNLGACTSDDCGGQSEDGACWCDELCASYGDCCENKVEVCDEAAKSCGGLLGLTCDDGEFCQYSSEASCGSADQMGVCATKPEACTNLYAPVCGCDGITHGNSCFAANAGTSVVHDGECGGPSLCLTDEDCSAGENCDHSECLSGCAEGEICTDVCYGQCQSSTQAPDSCEGQCGGNAGSCYCDDLCAGFGDCCDDKQAICDAPASCPDASCLMADCPGGGGDFPSTPLMQCGEVITHGECKPNLDGDCSCAWTCPEL